MATKKLFILFCILLSMVGTKALAYDIAVENADGMTICYNYINDGKELEVTYRTLFYSYSGPLAIPEEVTYMNITRKVTKIGEMASQYSSITSVSIPNSVTSIEQFAFYGCSDLTSLTIPNSVTSIGECAFSCCWGLTSLTIPSSVTKIDGGAFSDCRGISSFNVEEANTLYKSEDGVLMSKDGKTLVSYPVGKNGTIYTIPNSVTSIEDYAFSGCWRLTSITIPNSVTSIGVCVFSACTNLTSITIPNSVTSIGRSAFYNCSSLTSIVIPDNVTSIEYNVFTGCDILSEVISKIENPFDIYYNTFSDYTFNNGTLYVPVGTIDKYKATNGWKKFALIKESDGSGDTDVDEIKITSAGQTTWCSAYDLDFTNVEGLKAYIASGYHRTKGTIWLTRVKEVPAGEGILLIGDEGEYKVPRVATTAYYANLMVGTVEAITINETDGEYTNYYLSNGDSGVGFYKVNGSVDLKANRAYLPLLKNTVSGSRGFIGLEFDEDAEGTTGISNNNREPITNNIWYNLQGQRVDNPSKGLYIKNGKKVLIK